MKVGESLRAFAERLDRREEPAIQGKGISFKESYTSAQIEAGKERLEGLMALIDEAGVRLQERLSWQDLREYKRRIQTFLEAIVKEGYAMKDEYGYDRRGRTRLYRVLSEIDSRLARLSEAVVAKEQDRIDILSAIAEIKGMLVNLYL